MPRLVLDPRSTAVLEYLRVLLNEREDLLRMASDPSISDADFRAVCTLAQAPVTEEAVAWAREQCLLHGGG